MSSDQNDVFGFELLYKLSEGKLAKKEDVLILFVHWYFVKNGFKCLSTGDSKTINPNETGSEALPNDWNQGPNYSLRYVKDGKLFILMGIRSEGDLLLNLLTVDNQNVSSVQFAVDLVQNTQGNLETLIPSYKSILNTLKNDLFQPIYGTTGTEISTQTQQTSDSRTSNAFVDPLRVGPQRSSESYEPRAPGYPLPIGVGRDDLNPLGGLGIGGPRGTGGMLFDPFSDNRRAPPRPGIGIPGRLPPGAIPPGARFDPFGPDIDNPRPFQPPNPDHLPPPGYDDMFM